MKKSDYECVYTCIKPLFQINQPDMRRVVKFPETAEEVVVVNINAADTVQFWIFLLCPAPSCALEIYPHPLLSHVWDFCVYFFPEATAQHFILLD